tara:strand:- start:23 stop:631 length:609 start_codon:yes stop_codon:yes gene_type:complete
MEEKDTYQRVAIPMTEKQAHEALACETCKGFNESLQYLKRFTDLVNYTGMTVPAEMDAEYHKHLDLVASPDCDGQCVEGSTMSILCPCCKDGVYFNYSCFLPTEIECIHCSADLTGGDHAHQRTIRKIIKNHNQMRWTCKAASDHMINEEIAKYNDLREPRGLCKSNDIPSLHDALKNTVCWEDIVGPVKGYGEDTQEDEES